MSQGYEHHSLYKVAYENFWNGFDPHNNFLTRLLKLTDADLVVESHEDLDAIIISSHFKPTQSPLKQLNLAIRHFLAQTFRSEDQKSQAGNKTIALPRRIFYTGENHRVPQSERFSISHDIDDFGHRNIYYPYLFDHLLMAKLEEKDHIFGSKIKYEYLYERRTLKIMPEKFACIFFGNDVPIRRRLIDEMGNYGEVELFGNISGRYLDDRSTLINKFKYVLCPENDYYPGYVTEKIIHAYAMGAIPIYWGGLTKHQGVNEDSILTIDPSQSLKTQIARIANLDKNSYKEIYEQPLMLHEPNWQTIVGKILIWLDTLK